MTARRHGFGAALRGCGLVWLLGFGVVLWASESSGAWPSDPWVNLPVCTAGNNQAQPEIASDGAGGAFVCWADERSSTTAADIYVHHILSTGVLDSRIPVNGLAVCTAAGSQFNCKLTSDGAGGAYLTWQDGRSGQADVYAHRLLSSAQLDPAWPVNGLAVCAEANDQFQPEVAGDGGNGAYVVWRDFRSGATSDVFAHHILPSGNLDPAWPSGGLAVCTSTGNQRFPKLVGDASGGAIVVWDDYRGGAQSDIYAQHILAGGVVDPAWPANGMQLCGATGNQGVPGLVSDGVGGAIVAWLDYRAGSTADIYATRVLAEGGVAPGWPADGRGLCTAPGSQTVFSIVEAGTGDALVAWMDMRGGRGKIYAQRATGPTAGGWIPDGVPVSSRTSSQRNPRLVSDGFEGAIVAWQDSTTDLGDIYAEHLFASGDVDSAWPAGGRALCTALLQQQEPRTLADGSGGAIVAWMDERNGGAGNVNIYAQRVQSDGQLGGVVVGVQSPAAQANFSISPVWPNPSREPLLTISFELVESSGVTIEALDLTGRRVARRSAGELHSGTHTVTLAISDRAPSGLYFVRVCAGERTATVPVTLLK